MINASIKENIMLHNINLYEKWFPEVNEDDLEAIIVEATIVNWFNDEDANSEKVWRYFRAI